MQGSVPRDRTVGSRYDRESEAPELKCHQMYHWNGNYGSSHLLYTPRSLSSRVGPCLWGPKRKVFAAPCCVTIGVSSRAATQLELDAGAGPLQDTSRFYETTLVASVYGQPCLKSQPDFEEERRPKNTPQ